jgi:hypothetical protein
MGGRQWLTSTWKPLYESVGPLDGSTVTLPDETPQPALPARGVWTVVSDAEAAGIPSADTSAVASRIFFIEFCHLL